MAASLSYLTVQDMLWINLQVTSTVNTFQYARLEEATYTQYNYGGSIDVVAQARNFQAGTTRLAPFSIGNDATAFVASAAFLLRNGYKLAIHDGDRDPSAGAGMVQDHHPMSVRDTVHEVMERFPQTIAALGGTPVELIADGAIH